MSKEEKILRETLSLLPEEQLIEIIVRIWMTEANDIHEAISFKLTTTNIIGNSIKEWMKEIGAL